MPVEVVEAAGSRGAAVACGGAVDTCLDPAPVVGRTVAAVIPVVLNAMAEAVDTLAFEVGAAAEAPAEHCYQRSLATYATDDG